MEEAVEGGESIGEKLMSRINDELEYEGEDQEREELDEASDDEQENETVANEETRDKENDNDDDNENENDILNMQNLTVSGQSEKSSLKKKSRKSDRIRINRVLNISDLIADYSFDTENLRWAEVTLKVCFQVEFNGSY